MYMYIVHNIYVPLPHHILTPYLHPSHPHTLTLGSGEKRAPSHSSTTRMIPDDTNPTSCVLPPELACTRDRERLPAAVKELKREPTMFMAPHAMN